MNSYNFKKHENDQNNYYDDDILFDPVINDLRKIYSKKLMDLFNEVLDQLLQLNLNNKPSVIRRQIREHKLYPGYYQIN